MLAANAIKIIIFTLVLNGDAMHFFIVYFILLVVFIVVDVVRWKGNVVGYFTVPVADSINVQKKSSVFCENVF